MREARGEPLRVGRIVEVEAYGGPEDRASHARSGLTQRTAVMFGPAGLAYVYLVYGMYDCLNVVTGPSGEASAVLIRAIEPIDGTAAMRTARDRALQSRGRRATPATDDRLAAGPGLVCQALDVGRWATGLDLCASVSALRLEAAGPADRAPVPAWTARVGVAYAGEPWASRSWRLFDRSSRSVSASR